MIIGNHTSKAINSSTLELIQSVFGNNDLLKSNPDAVLLLGLSNELHMLKHRMNHLGYDLDNATAVWLFRMMTEFMLVQIYAGEHYIDESLRANDKASNDYWSTAMELFKHELMSEPHAFELSDIDITSDSLAIDLFDLYRDIDPLLRHFEPKGWRALNIPLRWDFCSRTITLTVGKYDYSEHTIASKANNNAEAGRMVFA